MMRLRLWHRNVLYRLIGFYSFSFLAPLYSPRPFAAPPGEKEEPTATFGHVFKAKKYSLEMHVDIISSPTAALLSTVSTAGGAEFKFKSKIQFRSASRARISIIYWLFSVPRRVYFLRLLTQPNRAVSPLFRPAGRERAGTVSGAKMKTNTNLSTTATQFDATGKGQPGLLGSGLWGASSQVLPRNCDLTPKRLLAPQRQ